jgi:hypothetical protein
MNNKFSEQDEEPPGICNTSSVGIFNCSRKWSLAWFREMVTVHYLPVPDIRFRLRYDLDVLASTRQFRQPLSHS